MDDQKNQFEFLQNHVSLQEQETMTRSGSSERWVSVEGNQTKKGLLRIKLKVPKANECSREEFVYHHSLPEKKFRVCKVCNKNFSSRRALGGHMRVHVQVEEDGFSSKKNRNSKLKIHRRKLKSHLVNLSVRGNSDHSNNVSDESIEGSPKTNNNITCSVCGKTFPSMKSLFGHMRCHPEREWRGIQPPRTAKNSSSSTVSDSISQKMDDQIDSATTIGGSAFDLVQSLPSWSVTAKRRQKSIASVNSEEQIPDAAYDLMMLAQGDSLDSGLSNKRRSEEPDGIEDTDHVSENLDLSKKRRCEESEAGNRDFQSKKLKIDGGSLKLRNEESEAGHIDFLSKEVKTDKWKGNSRAGFDSELVNMDSGWEYSDGLGEDSEQNSKEESESKYTDYNISRNQITFTSEIKKKKKKIKFRDLEMVRDVGVIDYKQTPITPNRFKCTSCNKSFPSHQALGGHRSSHKKGKNRLHTTDMEGFELADASAEKGRYDVVTDQTQLDDLQKFDDTRSKVVSKHQCKICNKTFPTGQALGGHKRCHRASPIEAPTLPEEVSKTGRRLLDFDLNELPLIEDHEESLESASIHSIGIKQPVDYASTSNNSVS